MYLQNADQLVLAKNLSKVFGTKKNPIRALGPVSLSIQRGSFTLILGKSGSGKSTLLNLLAGLDRPTTGELIVNNQNISKFSQGALAKYRSQNGVIFQSYNLLSNLSAVENVMMGGWAGGRKVDKSKAIDLMEKFGLGHRILANVKTLSGGEKQRVAICRSLISEPQILFCDEPTGALDSNNEKQVLQILKNLNDNGLSIILVTHSSEFKNYADNTIFMKDGKIETMQSSENMPKFKLNI
jgi:putative ABC transport system ATP-binding protein